MKPATADISKLLRPHEGDRVAVLVAPEAKVMLAAVTAKHEAVDDLGFVHQLRGQIQDVAVDHRHMCTPQGLDRTFGDPVAIDQRRIVGMPRVQHANRTNSHFGSPPAPP